MPIDPGLMLLLGLIIAAGALAFLHMIAVHFRHETALHDLKVEAFNLRNEHERRLARLRAARGGGPTEVNVDIIDEDTGDIETAQAAEPMRQAA